MLAGRLSSAVYCQLPNICSAAVKEGVEKGSEALFASREFTEDIQGSEALFASVFIFKCYCELAKVP